MSLPDPFGQAATPENIPPTALADKVGPHHVSLLLFCTLVMFIDGFDIFLIGKIGPAIADGLDISSARLTLIFLLQQIGLALGSFLVSPISDLLGRKRLIILSFALFGGLTLLAAGAREVLELAMLRGLSGVFLAVIIPASVAMLSEHTPRSIRSTFISIALGGYAAGGAASASLALIVDDFGWQAGFWVAGALPLLVLPLLMRFLPSSTAQRRQPEGERVPKSGLAARGDLLDVFRNGRCWPSIALWLMCFLSMGNIALLAAWLPTFFQEMGGISIQRFAVVSMLGFIGGLGGTLSVGYLIDRVAPLRLLPGLYLTLACMLFAMGTIPFDSAFFPLFLIAWSFLQAGGQTGLIMMMVRLYPDHVRGTGIGWANGMGRIGGIIAPLFGGYALATQLSLEVTLALIAIPPLTISILMLSINLRPVDVR